MSQPNPPPPPPPPANRTSHPGAPLTQPQHVRTHRGSECAVARGQEAPPKANNLTPRPCANPPLLTHPCSADTQPHQPARLMGFVATPHCGCDVPLLVSGRTTQTKLRTGRRFGPRLPFPHAAGHVSQNMNGPPQTAPPPLPRPLPPSQCSRPAGGTCQCSPLPSPSDATSQQSGVRWRAVARTFRPHPQAPGLILWTPLLPVEDDPIKYIWCGS